jgi:PIN domain nuclease of toxin-antitoxin system
LKHRLLLDSHMLLWWLSEHARLSARARQAITESEFVYVSAISAWELAIKAEIGKLKAPDDLEAQLRASRFVPLPVTVAHALAAGKLPRHHSDPFDRMLVAQASLESLTLLTSDKRLRAYDVQIMLA